MNTRLCALALTCSLLTVELALAQGHPKAVVQAGHLDPIVSATFSHDGKLLATTSEDKTTKIWHVATGALLHTFAGHPDGVRAAAFRPDGKEIVTGGRDGWMNIHDGWTGQRLRTEGNPVNVIYALAYTKDSELLAVAGSHTKVIVLDAKSGKELQQLTKLADGVNCLAFSERAKGHRLASGDKSGEIRIWNALGEAPVFTLSTAHRNGKDPKAKGANPEQKGVLALDYSPNGKLLASAGVDGTAKVWDAIEGKLLFTLKGHTGHVTGVGFVNANLIVTTGEDRTVRFWNPATGESMDPKAKVPKEEAKIEGAAVSPDGKHIVLIYPKRARLFTIDPAKMTLSESHPLRGGERGYCSAVSPDGKAIAVGSDGTIGLWRPGHSRPLITLHNLPGPVFSLAFSPNNKFLAAAATGDERTFVHVYDVATGKMTDSTFAHNARALSIAFSPDSKILVTAGSDRNIGVWGVGPAGKLLKAPFTLTELKERDQFYSVAFSPDGKLLAAGSAGRVTVWEVPGGKIACSFVTKDWDWNSLAFSPDGKSLAAGNRSGLTKVWNLETQKPRFPALNPDPKRDKYREEDDVYGVTYSPDGKYLVTAHGRFVHVWDANTGKSIERLFGHQHVVRSVAFTKDGKYLVSGSGDIVVDGNGDGQVKLWEFNREKNAVPKHAACTLVSFWDANKKEESWAVIDYHGRYDASRAGEVPWLHFVVDNEPVALSQVKDKYYEPHLLDKLLGLNPEALRVVKDLTGVKLPPRVEVKAKDTKAKTVTLGVTDKGGGIGRVQVFVNNKEVVADAKPTNAGVTVDLSKAPLRGKDDKVRVVTWNNDGTISNRGAEFDFAVAAPAAPARKAKLYAIVVGVSDYKNPQLKLQFAAKDAEDFGHNLETGAKRLFNGAEQVHVTVLSSSGNKGTAAATKENVKKAFETVAEQADADDVLVVFFAGHGVTLPQQDLYCYLTANAVTLNAAAFANLANRGDVVTSEDLAEWIRPIKADKQVMILDTCASGGLAAKVVPSSQIRAVEKLKDRTGFHILMGCAADKVSYEANQLKQGLLTYALLEGMQGAGMKSGDRVNVVQWFQHAWYMVPKLAEGIGGIQRPVISSPHGNPFDVCELTTEEREKIKLPQPRPRLFNPRLTNMATGGDPLGLEDKVRDLLDDRSAPRGDPLTFVPCLKLANAYHPVGTYEVKGNGVTISLRVEWNGKEVAKLPPVAGSKDKPEQLARDITKALVEWSATVKPDR